MFPCVIFSQRFLIEFDHNCAHHIAKQRMVSAVLLEKKQQLEVVVEEQAVPICQYF